MTPTDGVGPNVWRFFGVLSKTAYLEVREPLGCQNKRSDIISLIGGPKEVSVGRRKMTAFKVRVESSGVCDLDIRVPHSSDDPYAKVYELAFDLIWPCKDAVCSEGKLGLQIRRKIPQQD
jgi:hypothetical protein